MTKNKITLLLFLSITTIDINANAQEKTCYIDPQKKANIVSTLCGQAAKEAAYRFAGEGCARKSIEKRIEDNAIQIHMYRICGDKEFAEKMKIATLNSMKLMEKLLPCTREDFRLDEIMNRKIRYVQRRMRGSTCGSEMKSMIVRRRTAFEEMIKTANDPNTEKIILDKLGVSISENGSITDIGVNDSSVCGRHKNSHERLLDFFAGACLQTMPNIERVKAAARVMEWRPIEGDIAAMLAPAEKGAVWQGWAVKTDEDVFMVGVSEGDQNGRKMVGCTVMAGEINQNDLAEILEKELSLKVLLDENEAFQRIRGWQTEINGIEMLISLTTLSKKKISPATLSVATYQ